MKKIYNCRRTLTAIIGIGCLTLLGYARAADVAASIATIVLGVAGANSVQSIFDTKKGKSDE